MILKNTQNGSAAEPLSVFPLLKMKLDNFIHILFYLYYE